MHGDCLEIDYVFRHCYVIPRDHLRLGVINNFRADKKFILISRNNSGMKKLRKRHGEVVSLEENQLKKNAVAPQTATTRARRPVEL